MGVEKWPGWIDYEPAKFYKVFVMVFDNLGFGTCFSFVGFDVCCVSTLQLENYYAAGGDCVFLNILCNPLFSSFRIFDLWGPYPDLPTCAVAG